jgi:spore photoproduct lyase
MTTISLPDSLYGQHTMKTKPTYEQKLLDVSRETSLDCLPADQQAYIREQARRHRFTHQQLKQITEIAKDLANWNEASIIDVWPHAPAGELSVTKESRQRVVQNLQQHWATLKATPNSYASFDALTRPAASKPKIELRNKHKLGLGTCPVASYKTRCCNLMTLDAVENCGFDCSYCSIQSFYHDHRIYFDDQFAAKLDALELDPKQVYHIGTGQSSDSLMWGNKHGVLDALIAFARKHPNVILEMKTKSKNISHLLTHDVPRNLICTWSLNTQTIITHEEHLTASLEDRLKSARKVADRGIVVGFHFHPMVHYDNWRREYSDLFLKVQQMFDPCEVALVSLGTLTFIKPVVKQIRSRIFTSQILKMPLVDSDGKLSYPFETKLELFAHAYQSFLDWHDRVFFYLCMENHKLWKPVFGFEYKTNHEFEAAMKSSYMDKINRTRASERTTSDSRRSPIEFNSPPR